MVQKESLQNYTPAMAVQQSETTNSSVLLKEQAKTTVKPVWFDIPAFKSLPTEIDRVELVIFGWALLLFRRNYGADITFTWKLRDDKGRTCSAFDMRTKDMQWRATDPLSLVLNKMQDYMRVDCPSENLTGAESCTIFLNDEDSPNAENLGMLADKCDNSMQWVSTAHFK